MGETIEESAERCQKLAEMVDEVNSLFKIFGIYAAESYNLGYRVVRNRVAYVEVKKTSSVQRKRKYHGLVRGITTRTIKTSYTAEELKATADRIIAYHQRKR